MVLRAWLRNVGLRLTLLVCPNIKDVKWRWLLPGSVLAVALWLVLSLGFSFFLRLSDTFSATYGSLGAAIVLLLWIFLTGIAILLGGEVNAVVENAAAEAGIWGAKPRGQKAVNLSEKRIGANDQLKNVL